MPLTTQFVTRTALRRKAWRSHFLRALDLFVPQSCLECGTSLPDSAHRQEALSRGMARAHSPLCRRCDLALPWWRSTDGCPRCGCRPSFRASRRRAREHRTRDRTSQPFCADAGAIPIMEWSGEGCPRCLANGSPLQTSLALLRYEGPIRRWLPAFKDPGNILGPTAAIDRVIDYLATQLAYRFARQDASALDALIAVPLHSRRLRQRGFNQSEVIAARLARRLSVPFLPGALIRTRATSTQAGLRGQSRRSNLRGAFRTAQPFAKEARIGLVDDVLTTGSTLEAAAESVLDAGAYEVHAFTLASTVPGVHNASQPRSS